MENTKWSPYVVLAWAVGILGALGIVAAIPASDPWEGDLGRLGLACLIVGNALYNRELAGLICRRERAAFELGRESERLRSIH